MGFDEIRCTGVQFAVVTLAFFQWFYDLDKPFSTKVGFSQGVLADLRGVFQDAGTSEFEALFIPSQWVFRWIVDKLDVEVFSPVGRADISGLAALSYVEQNLVVELVRRFSEYRVPISVESLTSYVLQFGSTQRIRGAIRLLTHVKFYRLWELAQAVERLLTAELNRSGGEELVMSTFGEHTGSAAIMNYLVAHSTLASSLKFEPNLPAALAATPDNGSIYIVDDCLLSGTQGLNTLGDLMGTRVTKSHHTVHAQKLTASDKRRLRNRNLRFTYGVAMDDGMTRFVGGEYAAVGLDADRAKVLAGTIEPVSSRIFDPLGPVGWLNEEERDEMKAFCEDVGYRILERRSTAKGWTDQRRRESALGFSDRQRLLVFPYNVPKSTLTLLWERSSGDFHWNPLFPGFD
ncbi:phosphoribosyltransferase-like protein [Burkholderia lata]|uniref:phosphoribosyltransferase-like protein n=1 Tax=Burkholderia lata (strain ATCC 17760 / DSM 23089 / LMG 22485 / NCIMB 9086 / R18194 / 383) TaxID=482957 RepID=UPI003F68AE5A